MQLSCLRFSSVDKNVLAFVSFSKYKQYSNLFMVTFICVVETIAIFIQFNKRLVILVMLQHNVTFYNCYIAL